MVKILFTDKQTTDHIGEHGNHSNEYGLYVDLSKKPFEKVKLFRYFIRVANCH